MFVGGGITGVVLSACAIDVVLHDTYFVVAHFHQVMAIAAILAFSCGLPIAKQNFTSEAASVGILVFAGGTLILFTPMYAVGISGMPRRVPGYSILANEIMS